MLDDGVLLARLHRDRLRPGLAQVGAGHLHAARLGDEVRVDVVLAERRTGTTDSRRWRLQWPRGARPGSIGRCGSPNDSPIHKSYNTRRWPASNPKFELFFQPVYHPWVNVIERLCKTLHDTVTRNHRHYSMKALTGAVRGFMEVCQPWPRNAHALARA